MTVTEDDRESWDFTHTYIAQGEKIIAQVQQQSKSQGWPSVQSVDEMWANARLIAAAPEMLEACMVALATIKSEYPLEHGNPTIGRAWGSLESAIAKATSNI
jgi:hypothetical protein